MMRMSTRISSILIVAIGFVVGTGQAVDVINNGTFDTNISGWTTSPGTGTISHDPVWGGDAAGSLSMESPTGRNTRFLPMKQMHLQAWMFVQISMNL